MHKSVLVLGGVSWNTMLYVAHFPAAEPQTVFSKGFHETVGSTGSGKALNLSKLDFGVTLYGMVGADHQGDWTREYFDREDVPFVYDPAPETERHVNLMDDEGKRISIISRSGGAPVRPDLGRMDALIPRSDYIVLNISDYCRHMIPLLKWYGKEVWTDLHDYDGRNPYHRDFIDAADYIFLSSDSMSDYRAFMEGLIREGKKLAVCTHGSKGSTALTARGEWIETPAISAYERVDTNGAGDAFFSGFLHAYSRGCSTQICLRVGTIVAGLCITSSELALPSLSRWLVEAEYRKHYGEGL